MTKGPISYLPTDGLTYDPEDEKYWDENALQKEITRAFEICHGCRMCFKYCDSFPNLFQFIDDNHQGDVTQITAPEVENVMDNCFQCKLCEVQCPYTPRDSHEFLLDFPKLVHRYRAIKTKKEGVSFRDQVLANVDKAGIFSRLSFGMANIMNKVKAHRIFLEKLIGIHRDKLLPDFANTTFEKLAKKSNKMKSPSEDIEVVLFQTCYVQNNEPEIGRDTLDVLEKNKVKVACVEGLKCCGMPFWEHGDLETLRSNAKHNLDLLMPYIDKGAKVMGINPTCTMMMRKESPELLETKDREKAKKCAEAMVETGEYLWSIRKEERFNTDFKSTPGDSLAYHSPCHLRAQAVGFKGRDLLKKIPGVTPKSVMECCGHDGTFAMKKESFEASKKIGEKSFSGMKETESEVWATECPLAATQFAQHAGVRPLHPMSILARAYRKNGFPKKIKE
ncbi:MAG: heterodisulfide reductase-related iron-sulfur binding cluster [Bdellovibrionota bacterium]|nr:heterodisulfide reductase-related iron-sulfur binding cluster [Bdellovibrionota bacterium]